MDNLIIFLTKYLIFVIVFLVFVVWLLISAKTRRQLALSVLLSVALAFVIGRLASKFYFHHRPFVVNGTVPLVAHGDDNGFPSEHALIAVSLASVVYFYWRRMGAGLLILALLVGVGRVLADVHWPIDIVGGVIIGAFGGWAGYVLTARLVKNQRISSEPQKPATPKR